MWFYITMDGAYIDLHFNVKKIILKLNRHIGISMNIFTFPRRIPLLLSKMSPNFLPQTFGLVPYMNLARIVRNIPDT